MKSRFILGSATIIILIASIGFAHPDDLRQDRAESAARGLATGGQKTSHFANPLRPFTGTYLGTITLPDKTEEASLYLEQANEGDSGTSQVEQVVSRPFNGQLLRCIIGTHCFDSYPLDEANSVKLTLTMASYRVGNPTTILVYPSGGMPSCLPGPNCGPYKIELKLIPYGLTGTIFYGSAGAGTVTFSRVKEGF